ncbi:MAG: hypothetical protein Q9198_010360 [Flavoplaca austrocitrina]
MEDEEEGEEEVEDEEADMGDNMEIDSDELEGEDLGPGSYTVPMGEAEFFPYDKNKDVSLLGTIGLNSCSGVLIVGETGAISAHLLPISPQEGLNRDTFQTSVNEKVKGLYTKNKANLAGAKMYIAVPNGDNGEKAILEKAADVLEIGKDTTGYDRVADSVWDTENYIETGKGTIFVNFKDTNDLKVKVFGKDKEPPSTPAPSEGEQEGSEEGEIVEPEGSEEGEIVEDQMQQ